MIRGHHYSFQSLLLNVCNRNLFSCWHFETSSDVLFKSLLWFGYRVTTNFSWRHKKRCFMFVYGAAAWLISHSNVGVYFFVFFIASCSNVTGESFTVLVVFVSKWLGMIIISLFFKITVCKAKIHIFAGVL